jgi:hypothetical protein
MSNPNAGPAHRWIAYATSAERSELAEIEAERKRLDTRRRELTDQWRRLTDRLAKRGELARLKGRAA